MACKSCGGSAADLVEVPEPLCWACYNMWLDVLIAEQMSRQREVLERYSGMPWLGPTPIAPGAMREAIAWALGGIEIPSDEGGG